MYVQCWKAVIRILYNAPENTRDWLTLQGRRHWTGDLSPTAQDKVSCGPGESREKEGGEIEG